MKTLLSLFLFTMMFHSSNADEVKKPFKIYELGKSCPVILNDEYGIMLINDGWEQSSSPRYIFARLSTQTLLVTKSLEELKHALSRLPKEAIIYPYDSCTISRSNGIKKEHYEAYKAIFKELKLKVSEEERVICYCKK